MMLNNSGIMRSADLLEVTPEDMLEHYKVNCMGIIFTVQAVLKQQLLQSGALIANVTSLVRI